MVTSKSLIIAVLTSVVAGCSLLGYKIDKAVTPKEEGRPIYVDGQGEGRHVVPVTTKDRAMAGPGPAEAAGAEIDYEFLKALTTRRQQHDMTMRDESLCAEGETKVCSISAGCACKRR